MSLKLKYIIIIVVLGIIVIAILSIYPIFQESQEGQLPEKPEFNLLDFVRDIIPPNTSVSYDYDYDNYAKSQHILLSFVIETARTYEVILEMRLLYGINEVIYFSRYEPHEWKKITTFKVKDWTFNYYEYVTGSNVRVYMCTLDLEDGILAIHENLGLIKCKKILEDYLNDGYSSDLSFSTDKSKKIENMFTNCNEMLSSLSVGTGYGLEDWENIYKTFECENDIIDIGVYCYMEEFIPDCCKATKGFRTETEPKSTGFRVIQKNNYTLCAHEDSLTSELYGFSDGYCDIQIETTVSDAVDLSSRLGEAINLENIGFNEMEVCLRTIL